MNKLINKSQFSFFLLFDQNRSFMRKNNGDSLALKATILARESQAYFMMFDSISHLFSNPGFACF
jgi:hypothetical protein